jgi:hypothetical protein
MPAVPQRFCTAVTALLASLRPLNSIVRRQGASVVFGLFRKKPQVTPGPEADGPKGLIARRDEDGIPVIFRLVAELPDETTRNLLPWLTVIAWRYDGSSRNGMPPNDTNQKMIRLEDAIESLVRPGFMRHAYSRTGNGLKEFAYYINDRDTFIAAFNTALQSHERYPLDINFYSDPEWKDFTTILGSISPGHGA